MTGQFYGNSFQVCHGSIEDTSRVFPGFFKHTRTHQCMQADTSTRESRHTDTHTPTHTHLHTQTHTHTHTQTHTQKHTH